MPKETPQHNDLFGQPLEVGDCVVYPRSNNMYVGTVRKLNAKMIGIAGIKRWGNCNKYPEELVKVSGPAITMYLLKNQS